MVESPLELHILRRASKRGGTRSAARLARVARQPLLQEEALAPRRVVQLAKDLIAELAVEARGLEAERVDPGRVAAALQRPGLGAGHEFPPDPLAPKRVADPHITAEETAKI